MTPSIYLAGGTPPGTPPPSHAGLPTTSTTSPSKRHRDAADAEVVKRIRANEIVLHDRSSVLHGSKAGVSIQPHEAFSSGACC